MNADGKGKERQGQADRVGFLPRHLRIVAISLLLPWLGVAATNQPPTTLKTPETHTTADGELVRLRGKVVCLPEEMHLRYQASLPTGHEHVYGFKTGDGKYYTLLRTKFSEALFADARFREKELVLKGRVFPRTQIFEPTTIRSVHNGVVHDLYYYCDICDIEAVAPGSCECCQGPTELVEKPLEGKSR